MLNDSKDTKKPDNNDTNKGQPPKKISDFWKISIFWIILLISLIVALYFAYMETIQENNLLNIILPNHITHNNNTIIIKTNATSFFKPDDLEPPFIPRFIILWGYIGFALYVLKVTTTKINKKSFNLLYLPEHIARLFIGTVLAIFVFFVLVTGGFFGLTIDVTKISNPDFIEYVYAAVAFVAGYSARAIIKLISTMINSVLNMDDERDREKKKSKDDTSDFP